MCADADLDPPRARTVLIVDDDPAIRELLREILTAECYGVLEAPDGRQAIEQARLYQPAAILLDLMMPVMSGADAAAILKADPATAAIPVLTMSAGRNLTAASIGVLADDFIAKPFDLTALIDTVNRFTALSPNRSAARDRVPSG